MIETHFTRRNMLAALTAGAATPLWAQSTSPVDGDSAIDSVVRGFMARFDIPGIAVAVIRPGRPDYVRGYGVRSLGRPDPVDRDTQFGIASNSKAFTAAALAILVDEGRIGWDEPVLRYLPDFRMYDPAVTQMMTVRDLLVHRSGLGLGQGDLMLFPATTHSREDILRGLQYLKPERGFRAGYAYDNILYVIAGLLIERVSGISWEAFVTARLLRPVGMRAAVPTRSMVTGRNIAGRHARLGPPLRGIGPTRVVEADDQDKMAAAGGINASVADIAPWLRLQLAGGLLPDGRRLWSAAQAKEMATPQIITADSAGPSADRPDRPVMSGYALGLHVQDYRGHRLLSHGGALTGQITQQALLPDLGCAVAVYSNIEERLPVIGLRNALLDQLVGATAFDWIAATAQRIDKLNADALAEVGAAGPTKPEGVPSLDLAAYAGRYRDRWYGDIVIENKGGGLVIAFLSTPAFKGALESWGTDRFRTRFPEGAGEDALVRFAVAGGVVTGVTMKPLSPLADFSFDYQHLDFTPVR